MALTLDQATIAKLAEHLENAELQIHDVTKITDDYPNMDWDDAYAIQDEIKRRKLARGNKIAGLKAGLRAGLLAIGDGGFAVRDRLGAVDDDAGAALSQAQRDRAAEAGCRSGDEGNLCVMRHLAFLVLSWATFADGLQAGGLP